MPTDDQLKKVLSILQAKRIILAKLAYKKLGWQ